MKELNPKEIGQRIRKQRTFLNMSRDELARKLNYANLLAILNSEQRAFRWAWTDSAMFWKCLRMLFCTAQRL